MPGRFEITGGLTGEQLKLILDDTHQLLDEVGLEIDHPGLLEELAGHDGVTVRDKRVCYAPELVERARTRVPEEDTNYACSRAGDDTFRVVPPFSPFDVIDFDSGEKRPAEERDVTDGARLYDAFDVTGPPHVHIAGMDQKTAQMHIAKLCAENSRGVGNWSAAFNYEQAAAIRDMYLAAGREGEPAVAFQMTHSPLRLDAYFLDIVMRLRDSENGTRGIAIGGGSMPLPGVSAPIHWRAAAAQGLAECLGGWITAKLIDPDIRPYASFLIWAPDLSTCTWSPTTPESKLFQLLNQQAMQELLGLSMYVSVGDLSAMCLAALEGTRVFEAAGLCEGCFSTAHIPIDLEKLNFVETVASGMDMPDEPGLAARIVKETFPETTFLAHPSSLDYRTLTWQPQIFTGRTPAELSGLLDAPSDELLADAREIARERIAANEFTLSDDARREVDRIYQRGVAAVRALPQQ